MPEEEFTEAQKKLLEALEWHRIAELDHLDVEATLKTMVDEPYIFILANLGGGLDQAGVRQFYTMMLSQLPADMEWIFISQTVGNTQIVLESILEFTHDIAVDWVFPKVPPTNSKVSIPLVIIFSFRDGKVASERLYWDQASALAQIGVIDPGNLPITGKLSAERLLELTHTLTGDPRCVLCNTALLPQLLPVRDETLTDQEHDQLWDLYAAIAHNWEIPDIANQRSSWQEFIQEKTAQPPSFVAEYSNAAAVLREVTALYGEEAGYRMILFKHGLPAGPPLTRLAHAKAFVVDEFMRILILLGGFKSFVADEDKELANYEGYMGGSRYNRKPTVRPHRG
jgi:carboxymethylenebutenolidase